jgi:heme oxygenase
MLLLERLKADTASQHERAERRLNLMRPELSRADWVETLKGFYGFVRPWERAVGAWGLAYPAERLKAAFLERDLAHFGVDAGGLPECGAMPRTDDLGRALGSAYVLEGSTLGGRHVARRVEGHLGLSGGLGYSYFVCYGGRTGAMWNAFRETLTRLAARLDQDAIVDAARETFDRLGDWLATADARPREAACR